MGIVAVLRYIISSRVVWLSLCIPALLFYQAIASEPIEFWGGWTVLAGYLHFVAFIIEFTVRELSKVPWKSVDSIDLVLSIVLGFAVAALASTVAVDLIPENYTSPVYATNNLLSTHICDEIVRVSELHAQHNIQSLLEQYEGNSSHPKVAGAIASGGWLTTRHANYPTTDISAFTIKHNMTLMTDLTSSNSVDFVAWLNGTVENTIFPMLLQQFDLVQRAGEAPLLHMQDLFVVKYDADNPYAQRHLEVHSDSSQVSFNIALSTHDESAREEAVPSGDAHAAAVQDTSSSYSGGGTFFVRSGDTVHTPRGAMLSHASRLYHAGSPITRGKRYILVGFVGVRGDAPSTIYRRFGMFSRCIAMISTERSISGAEGGDSQFTVLSRADAQCQTYPYVFLYEVAIIVLDPFMKARTNPKSFWLAAVFAVTIVLVLLSVLSIVMLIVYPDDPPTARPPTHRPAVVAPAPSGNGSSVEAIVNTDYSAALSDTKKVL